MNVLFNVFSYLYTRNADPLTVEGDIEELLESELLVSDVMRREQELLLASDDEGIASCGPDYCATKTSLPSYLMTWCEEAARQGECEAPSRDAGKVFRPPPLVSLDNSLLLSSEVDLGSMASELVDTVRRFCTSFAGGIEEINVSFHGELNKRLLASWLEWILRQQTHFPIPCNVQRINLSHTSLGDVGIRILADVLWPAKGTGIRHLTVLDVSDVLLTDVGFSAMCTKMSAYWGKLDTADAYASVLVDELCLSNNYLTSAVEESLIALLCDFRHHSFPLPLVHIIDVSNSLVFNKVSGLNLPMHTLANCLQPCDGLNFPRPDRTRVDMQLQCCAMSDLIVRNSLFFFFQDYGVKIQLYNDLLFSATCLTRDGEDGIGVKTSSPPRPTYNVRQFFVSQMRPRLPDSPITPLFTVGSHLTVIDFSYNINIGDKGVCDMLRLMLNFDYISFFYSQSIEVDEENDLGKYIELSNHYFVFMKEIRLRCVGMGPASLLLFNMLLRPFETFNDFEQHLQCDGDNNALAERISHMNKRIPTFVKDSSADRRGKYPLPFLSLLDISENHLVTDGNIGGMVDVIRNSVTRCQCTSDFLSPDAPFRLYVEKCGLQDHVVKEAARQLKSIQQRVARREAAGCPLTLYLCHNHLTRPALLGFMQVLEGVFSQDQIKAYFEGNFLDESCRAVDEEHEMGRNGAQRSVFGNKTPMSWERLREQQGYGGVELSELRSGTSINGSSTPRETSRDHVIDHITLRRLLSESAQIIAERQPEPFGSTIRYNEDMEEEAN